MCRYLWFFVCISLFPSICNSQDDVRFGVVKIQSTSIDSDSKEELRQTGTGFVVEITENEITVVTARHVVTGDPKPLVTFYGNQAAPVRATTAIASWSGENQLDLAVLKVPRRGVPPSTIVLPFVHAAINDGTNVAIVGHPQGGESWQIIRATVSAHNGHEIVLDRELVEGLSGGPIFSDSSVIGVVTGTTNFGRGIVSQAVTATIQGWGVNPPEQKRIVPDVRGKTLSDTQTILELLGLRVKEIKREQTDVVPPDTVYKQDPQQGIKVPPGTEIILTMAVQIVVTVPKVTGDDQRLAENKITGARLVVGTVDLRESDRQVGTVIEQLPQRDEKVPIGQKVNLVVAKKPTVLVPNIVGMMGRDAEDSVRGSRLRLGRGTPQRSDTVPLWTIILQSPTAGTRVDIETPVDATFAQPGLVLVPNLSNQTLPDATLLLTTTSLQRGSVNNVFRPDMQDGVVVEQNPLPSTQVMSGSTVSLKINSSKQVPDLRGRRRLDAQTITQAGSLRFEIQSWGLTGNSSLTDTVFEQQPPANTNVAINSQVRVSVQDSLTVQNVQLPNGGTQTSQQIAGVYCCVKTFKLRSVQQQVEVGMIEFFQIDGPAVRKANRWGATGFRLILKGLTDRNRLASPHAQNTVLFSGVGEVQQGKYKEATVGSLRFKVTVTNAQHDIENGTRFFYFDSLKVAVEVSVL